MRQWPRRVRGCRERVRAVLGLPLRARKAVSANQRAGRAAGCERGGGQGDRGAARAAEQRAWSVGGEESRCVVNGRAATVEGAVGVRACGRAWRSGAVGISLGSSVQTPLLCAL